MLGLLFFLANCAHGPNSSIYRERGIASWYGPGFQGKKTACGERFNMFDITAAHRTLPIGSIVMVRRISTGQTVKVRINDRGPFSGHRIIDLSYGAAKKIEIIDAGMAEVELEVVSLPETAGRFSQLDSYPRQIARIVFPPIRLTIIKPSQPTFKAV